jgi:hypothetical protein
VEWQGTGERPFSQAGEEDAVGKHQVNSARHELMDGEMNMMRIWLIKTSLLQDHFLGVYYDA